MQAPRDEPLYERRQEDVGANEDDDAYKEYSNEKGEQGSIQRRGF